MSKSICRVCNKGKGTFKCEGCSTIFCPKHSIEHRNDLSKQLEEIELAQDLAFKNLSQQIQNLREHSLIQFVDQWEYQSIEKIRQVADQTRINLLKDIGEHNNLTKKKLEDLSEQLRQARDDNDFLEDDLQQWINVLEQLKSELQHPVNITIEQDSTPIVHQIRIERQIRLEDSKKIETNLSLHEYEQFFLKDDSDIHIETHDGDDHQNGNHSIHSQIELFEQNLDQ